jgi:tetratricopeptide (TPR) repeat protein
MIPLKEILHSFSKDQQQEFLFYLDKKNKRKDAKDIQLVNLLLLNTLSSKEICTKIYGKENKAALHALRKRLFDSIINFTANTNLKEESSTDMLLIRYILSARTFLQKGQFDTGYKILDKAEVIAKEYQLFPILNEIYHSKIQYAYTNPALKLEELIAVFKENQQQYLHEEELNIAYCKIRKTLQEVHHLHKIIDIKMMIENVFEEHKITANNSLSFKSLYQLIQITNISSSQNFDYYNIESFLMETYNQIKIHKSKYRQLFYHIEILYVISNTLFRNKKFEDSLEYLESMLFYMQQNKGKYQNEFQPKYVLLKSLIYNFLGKPQKAIAILEPIILKKNINTDIQLDLHLCLIVCYFQQKELQKAYKLFSKLYHSDSWYIEKVGIEWTIKKSLLEILLHVELGNINMVDSRILSFKRKFRKHLKEIHQEKVITYVQFVEMYSKNPEVIANIEFHEKVENSFIWIGREKEDIFMMSFFAWLKAKMTKQDIYLVTLELVKG